MLLFEDLSLLLSVALIIVLTYVATKIIRLLVKGIFRSGVPIVAMHVERVVTVIIWVLGILLVTETLGLKIDIVLLILGLSGVAGIVALKDVLQSVAAKYFSDTYLPFKLGDEIIVLGHTGKVIGINAICTILLDKEEKMISIPNSVFMKEPVVNITQAAWKEVIMPFIVPANVDIAEFEEIVLKACNKLKMYWDENFPPLFTIKERDEKNIRIDLTLMVNSPEKKEKARDEMNKKIMEILQKLK